MSVLRVAVVGVGHLGKEHARILAGLPGVQLMGVADPNLAQAEAVALRCGTRAFPDHQPLLAQVDAAVVAAPTCFHQAVGLDFLRRGIPLLVEKPLASDVAQADALVELAARHRVLLQVGHIERFNPAFEQLQRLPLVPKMITCQRLGPFSGRSTDIGAVMDMMIHDLDLVLALVGSAVREVVATGMTVLGGHEDVAQARVGFENGCVATLAVSRVNAGPCRRMEVWGPEGFAAVDFAARKLSLVQPSAELSRLRDSPRRPGCASAATLASLKAELYGRYLQSQERECQAEGDQLTRELTDFVHCVRTGERPRVTGEDGRAAVALASRILAALRLHSWDGRQDGPAGPLQLPAARGPLFQPLDGFPGAAAA